MFESIMESKIQQWQKEKSKPNYTPPPEVENTYGRPLEQDLVSEIETLIIKASKSENNEKKDTLLLKARRLETQLLISFENQGLNLLAQSMQNRLEEFRKDKLLK